MYQHTSWVTADTAKQAGCRNSHSDADHAFCAPSTLISPSNELSVGAEFTWVWEEECVTPFWGGRKAPSSLSAAAQHMMSSRLCFIALSGKYFCQASSPNSYVRTDCTGWRMPGTDICGHWCHCHGSCEQSITKGSLRTEKASCNATHQT